jgi:phosphatidylserine/phosphatidylglycerophosphate/cardiolipin synthase-like enzyme
VSFDKELREIGIKTSEAHKLEEDGKTAEAVELLTQLSQQLRLLADRAESTPLRGVLMQRSREFANNATLLKRKQLAEEPAVREAPEPQGMAEVQLLRGPLVAAHLLQMLQSAQYRVLIATHELHGVQLSPEEKDKSPVDLLVQLRELHESGVKVRILTTPPGHLPGVARWKQADALRTLAAAGVEFRVCPRLHFNSILVDDTGVWRGTAPLTQEALAGLDDVVEYSAAQWLKAVHLDLFRARWERSDLTCAQCSEKTCLTKFKSEDPRRTLQRDQQS